MIYKFTKIKNKFKNTIKTYYLNLSTIYTNKDILKQTTESSNSEKLYVRTFTMTKDQ